MKNTALISEFRIKVWKNMALEAKCPKCSRRAEMDVDTQEINCRFCGFHAQYDEYLEIMKGRAEVMADDFLAASDKNPF